MLAEADAGLATHGEAAEVNVVEVEGVEQMENIVREKFDGARTGRRGRLAVAACAVAEEAIAGREGGELRVPHGEICPERSGEDEDGRDFRAREGVVGADVAEIGKGHGSTFRGALLEFAAGAGGEEDGVNQCGRGAKVVEWIEETIEVGGGEFGLRGENVAEMAPG